MFSKVVAFVALFGIALASLEPVHAPQPYKFGYNIKDKQGEQYREEEGNGAGGVKGSYGFTDDRGVKRQVDYVADKAGFRAQVKTNEPGTANQDPAAVKMISEAPYAGGVAIDRGYEGYGVNNLDNGDVRGNEYRSNGRYLRNIVNEGYGNGQNLGYGGYGLGENLGNEGYSLGGNLGYQRYGLGGNLGYRGYGLGGNVRGNGYGNNGLGNGYLRGLGYGNNGLGNGYLRGLGYGNNGIGNGYLRGLGYGRYGNVGNLGGLGNGRYGLGVGFLGGLGYGLGGAFGRLGYARYGY